MNGIKKLLHFNIAWCKHKVIILDKTLHIFSSSNQLIFAFASGSMTTFPFLKSLCYDPYRKNLVILLW